jgi:hypothetical protein
VVIAMGRRLRQYFWYVIPHHLRPESQFASGVCARCGVSRDGWHLKGARR